LNFLEQAAIDHAAAAGYDVERLQEIGGLFIARRHEVDYHAPAAAGDRLQVRTWAVSLRGARAIRAYEIWRLPPTPLTVPPPANALLPPEHLSPAAGGLIVRARTEWAFVDAATGRPRRIPDEMAAAFLRS
jgi:acyl-CoA thioester hydrolase